MTALSTVTVGAGGAANIEFTNIPSTYTDLVVKITARSSSSDTSIALSFNNNTSNRTTRYLFGNGSSASSSSDTNMYITSSIVPSTSSPDTFSNAELYIPNYAGSNNKSSSVDGVSENNATASNMALTANLWSDTAAITSIKLTPAGGSNFVQFSTATLYGVWKGPETLPSTPTIGTATATGATTATVAFTPTSATGVDANYTALSSPGSITATGTSSPITVSGLTTNTAYTFQVRANNPGGSSAYSAASNSVTPNVGDFESIATVTVGAGGTSNIEFTGITSSFKHLQLRMIGLMTTAGGFTAQFNSDTATNYSWHQLYGNGSNALSNGGANQTSMYIAYSPGTATQPNGAITDILDYANTNKFKTIRSNSGCDTNGGGGVQFWTGNWRSTSAITSIKIIAEFNFNQYSQIALYGIRG